MSIRKRVVSLLAHTRFVPTPVYRLMALAWVVSGVLQLIFGAPNSVQQTSGDTSWFDWTFVIVQLLAAGAVLFSLYYVGAPPMRELSDDEDDDYADRLRTSLYVELFGIIGLQTVIAVQVAASAFYQGRVPSAGTTWMAILFALYLIVRERDIVVVTRKLVR